MGVTVKLRAAHACPFRPHPRHRRGGGGDGRRGPAARRRPSAVREPAGAGARLRLLRAGRRRRSPAGLAGARPSPWASWSAQVLHTPGHTPGSVGFYFVVAERRSCWLAIPCSRTPSAAPTCRAARWRTSSARSARSSTSCRETRASSPATAPRPPSRTSASTIPSCAPVRRLNRGPPSGAMVWAMARILIIDDNETMREGMAATVRRMGHEAVVAGGGRRGTGAHAQAGAGLPHHRSRRWRASDGLEVVEAARRIDADRARP